MKIVKTNIVLKDFSGKELKRGEKDLTAGEALSEVLATANSNSTLAWILGKKFACDKQVELKAEEVVYLKKEIEENKYWVATVKGQLIEILEESDKK